MHRIIVKHGEKNRLLAGHPWVYDNEISEIKGTSPVKAGAVADVKSCDKKYIGRAFVNPKSKIYGRIFSASKEGGDKGFFKHKQRIRKTIRRRYGLFDFQKKSVRLVFGEADFLPGLVVDRFAGLRGGPKLSFMGKWPSIGDA